MEIVDISEKYHTPYFCCLEEWSDEIKEAGNHKELWFNKMIEKGLRVKLALVKEQVVGMIQYTPSEYALIEGSDLFFINCIWVHGYKEGVGKWQKKGIGKALLSAAEEDVKALGRKGVVAWGLMFPFWMKASWYKKHGYKKVEREGIALLLWKPFTADAEPPHWIKKKKKPPLHENKVTVTSFLHGWCPAFNLVHERAKRAAAEFGDKVIFQSIDTFEKEVIQEWGIADALFIDDKEVNCGPPPNYEKIKKLIEKRVKKLR